MAENSAMLSTKSKEETVQAEKYAPTLSERVVEIIVLVITTLVLLATFLVNILSNIPGLPGFANGTGEASNRLYTQITPTGPTFGIWGIIYFVQCVWIIYGWSFVFRPKVPRGIHPITYIFYSITNLGSIIWVFLWGNLYGDVCFPFIIICVISLYAAITAQAIHLYRQSPALSSTKAFKVDLWISRILVLNGLAIYAAWLSVATQINFAIVLDYYGDLDATDAATVGFAVLTFEVLVYFVLQNTILDRFLRFEGIIYVVLIWALSGSLAAHWPVETDRRNPIFSLCLLILVIVLFLVRIVLWIVFAFKRPLPMPGKKVQNQEKEAV